MIATVVLLQKYKVNIAITNTFKGFSAHFCDKGCLHQFLKW